MPSMLSDIDAIKDKIFVSRLDGSKIKDSFRSDMDEPSSSIILSRSEFVIVLEIEILSSV